MTAVIEAVGLGKQYGRRWALSDCTLDVPAGKVVGLVGPNGAGKTTLLHLAVGLLHPTAGTIAVLGEPPAADAEQLGRVGFVAQDTPVYRELSVAGHLRFGSWTNPGWDRDLAAERIARLGLDPRQKAGKLSGGQRAQLALTLAVAKRPELLILDEPVASLDPLARREFLQGLMEVVADHGVSVILSSHLVADLERVCDYLVVLVGSRVQVAGDIETLLASHHRLVGPRHDPDRLPAAWEVIEAHHTDVQSTVVVRSEEPILDPSWSVDALDLEDLVLAYMRRAAGPSDRAQLVEIAMIRFTLRQFRTEAIVGAVLLVAVIVALAVTGPHLAHVYDACRARGETANQCHKTVRTTYKQLQSIFPLLVIAAPVLVGIFFGAPLVAREFETGTFRLAWTQGVTRRRWVLTKLGLVGAACMALCGVLTWLVDWWLVPVDAVSPNRFSPANFGFHGIVPIGYAAFAFVFGAAAGTVFRRTLPAMALTVAGFIAARWMVTYWIRPYLATPVQKTLSLAGGTGAGLQKGPTGGWGIAPPQVQIPNALVQSVTVVGTHGGHATSADILAACPALSHVPVGPTIKIGGGIARHVSAVPAPSTVQQVFGQCLQTLSKNYHTVVSYQPADRFWPFQWAETGIFVGAALLLAALCYRLLRGPKAQARPRPAGSVNGGTGSETRLVPVGGGGRPAAEVGADRLEIGPDLGAKRLGRVQGGLGRDDRPVVTGISRWRDGEDG